MNKRPLGISLLAIVFFIGGCLSLLSHLLTVDHVAQLFNNLSIPNALRLFPVISLGATVVAAGVGMWTGKRWAWWLSSFYLFYAIARSTRALLIGLEFVDPNWIESEETVS